MGSGGLVVMDENTCMVEVARFFMSFTQRESCGNVFPAVKARNVCWRFWSGSLTEKEKCQIWMSLKSLQPWSRAWLSADLERARLFRLSAL